MAGDRPVTVVKIGGEIAVDAAAVCADVAALAAAGRSVVLVHGGAAELDRLAARLGVPQRRLTTPKGSSSRYTDPATLEVLMLALAGKVKPALLVELAGCGASAVGLTGLDGGLLRARRTAVHRAVLDGRTKMIHDDHNGTIQLTDPTVLRVLLAAGIVPVVSPPALGLDGRPVNVDADRVAAAVADALGAAELVYLTGAPGLLRDPADETTVRESVELPATGRMPAEAVGGMAAKLMAARDALVAGVRSVRIADGRGTGPLRAALAGAGTTVRLAPAADQEPGGGPGGARADGQDAAAVAAQAGGAATRSGERRG